MQVVIMVIVGILLIGTGHYAVFEEHATSGWVFIGLGLIIAGYPLISISQWK